MDRIFINTYKVFRALRRSEAGGGGDHGVHLLLRRAVCPRFGINIGGVGGGLGYIHTFTQVFIAGPLRSPQVSHDGQGLRGGDAQPFAFGGGDAWMYMNIGVMWKIGHRS